MTQVTFDCDKRPDFYKCPEQLLASSFLVIALMFSCAAVAPAVKTSTWAETIPPGSPLAPRGFVMLSEGAFIPLHPQQQLGDGAQLLLVDLPVLHHELHILQQPNVLQRVAVHRNDIRELAR